MDVIYEQNLKHVLENAGKLNQLKQTIEKNDHDTKAKGSEATWTLANYERTATEEKEDELMKPPIVEIFQSSLRDIEVFYGYDSSKFAVRYNGEPSLTWLHRDQLQNTDPRWLEIAQKHGMPSRDRNTRKFRELKGESLVPTST